MLHDCLRLHVATVSPDTPTIKVNRACISLINNSLFLSKKIYFTIMYVLVIRFAFIIQQLNKML